jgi:hypothetical protein
MLYHALVFPMVGLITGTLILHEVSSVGVQISWIGV